MIRSTTLSPRFRERLELWREWHRYLLGAKGLPLDTSIADAIAIDLVNSMVVAQDLAFGTTMEVLEQLLSSHPEILEVVMTASDHRALDHIGFKVYEPMDLYMEGVPIWAERLGWELMGTKRFSPSSAFQQRVGASAEMAQVWLRKGDVRVELELFDIHLPFGGAAQLADRHRMAAATLESDEPYPDARSWALFEDDEIWHYGIRLKSTGDVALVHEALAGLTSGHRELVLRNESVVVNRWHGSHHTKLANEETGVEVEFLSYIEDPDAA